MRSGQPSKTAYSAARYRAAHQIIEGGSIFRDALAVRMLGEAEEDLLADAPRRAMRLFIAARHRFAEDALAAAVRRGSTLSAGQAGEGGGAPHLILEEAPPVLLD